MLTVGDNGKRHFLDLSLSGHTYRARTPSPSFLLILETRMFCSWEFTLSPSIQALLYTSSLKAHKHADVAGLILDTHTQN